MTPFNCPTCGRFSRDGWEVQGEHNDDVRWGAICKVHGDWQNST